MCTELLEVFKQTPPNHKFPRIPPLGAGVGVGMLMGGRESLS